MQCQVGRAQRWHKGSLGFLSLGLADSLSLVLQHKEQEIGFQPEDLNILSNQCNRAGPVGITLLEVREEPKSDQSDSTRLGGCGDLHGCRLRGMPLNSKESCVNLRKEILAYTLPCCDLASTADRMHQIALVLCSSATHSLEKKGWDSFKRELTDVPQSVIWVMLICSWMLHL